MEQLISILRHFPIFQDLNDTLLRELAHCVILHCYPKKTKLFLEGEPITSVFFIRKGLIKMYKIDSHGEEQIISFLKSGDMFPHSGFFNRSPYPATSELLEPAELISIPVQSFEHILLKHPRLCVNLMDIMGEKLRELQNKFQAFIEHDVQQRIVSFLLGLAREHGVQRKNCVEIHLPITNQEFAKLVGTTRESVNRIFNQLKKDKIIATDRKKISILNAAALHSLL